jgi:hypothetical protein
MIQFYLISVILNIVGGYTLCPDAAASRGSSFDGVRSFLRERSPRLVLGILSAVTGAFKLLTVMRGDVPVVGDFLPATVGIAVGATLLIDIYGGRPSMKEGAEGSAPKIDGKLERFLMMNKGAIGIAGIIAGVVHFLFPMVMFL